ncbi:neprilysin-like 16 isoform X4 [Haematobia irritans]|uniref:neprilysin-like 16 isoform X4 n=1 Tax=Haematobia irritans TaxID=7368 RepID=UPI003F4F731D
MTPNNIFNTMMAANPTGGSHSALLQKQMSFKSSVGAKPEDMDNAENSNAEIPSVRYTTNSTFGFICCAPCTWLRSSTAVHKIAITTATLLVTSLLVVSPILFLISTAPSQLPRNCYTEDEKCKPTTTPPPECLEPHCRAIAHNIHSTVNWKFNPCEEFKKFSCRNNTYNTESFSSIQSAQKAVDLQMEELLQHNTISGPFRKLGRLYGSCLRQSINSSSLRLILNQLGGYLPIGAVGPSSISELISKIYNMGPTPIVDIYFDLSYGKHPHAILIVSAPSTAAPILESKIRWMGPKAPPYNVKRDIPKLLPDFIETFLPNDLTLEQRASENEAITTFIKELNKILVEHTRRGFWDSTVLYNISSMFEMYPTLNWTSLIPSDWNGPIVVRSSEYMKAMEWLLTKYSMRVAHNSILVLFALGILPQDYPNPKVCTKATMWALPDIASSLLIAQYSASDINEAVKRPLSDTPSIPRLPTHKIFFISITKIADPVYVFNHENDSVIHPPKTSTIFNNKLNFLSRNQGRFKQVAFEDQRSIKYFKAALILVGEVWEGAALELVEKKNIPARPRAHAWIPDPPDPESIPTKLRNATQIFKPLIGRSAIWVEWMDQDVMRCLYSTFSRCHI